MRIENPRDCLHSPCSQCLMLSCPHYVDCHKLMVSPFCLPAYASTRG